jgi:hypothetical protein
VSYRVHFSIFDRRRGLENVKWFGLELTLDFVPFMGLRMSTEYVFFTVVNSISYSTDERRFVAVCHLEDAFEELSDGTLHYFEPTEINAYFRSLEASQREGAKS